MAADQNEPRRGERRDGATSRSAKIRKPAAVAAFGADGDRARKLRGIGDTLDDVIAGMRNRDPLVLGNARKLLAEWSEIGEPLLWYPTEIRCDGKLVIAAELERAGFVLPAYQAGLRAVLLKPGTSVQDLLTLSQALLRLELGKITPQAFFSYFWCGNPSGLGTLLGYPLDAIASTVLEHEIPAKDIWAAHTAAAMDEWNSLAWAAAQTHDAAALQRYRVPVERLVQHIERGDLGLSADQQQTLRDACDDEAANTRAERALLLVKPELAAWLQPERAAEVMRDAIDGGDRLPTLLSYLGQMSEDAAAAALASNPSLMRHAPQLCLELLAASGDDTRAAPLARALLANNAHGARSVADELLVARGEGYELRFVAALLDTLVELGFAAELVLPFWKTPQMHAGVRAISLRALGRDREALQAALDARPVDAADALSIHEAAASVRLSVL